MLGTLVAECVHRWKVETEATHRDENGKMWFKAHCKCGRDTIFPSDPIAIVLNKEQAFEYTQNRREYREDFFHGRGKQWDIY